jgi:hypothetical protein
MLSQLSIGLGVTAFVLGLIAWFWWLAYTDWRQGRAPAASTLTKIHYAKRSVDPLVFWCFTVVRLAFGVTFTLAGLRMLFQLYTAHWPNVRFPPIADFETRPDSTEHLDISSRVVHYLFTT